MTNRLIILAGLTLLSGAAMSQSFFDSFENATYSGTPPNTGNTPGDTVTSVVVWDAINRTTPIGTTGWFSSTLLAPPSHGNLHISANFNNGSGTADINNWLISPVRTFNNGDTISFFTRTVATPGFPDRLRLRLSTSGSSTAEADFGTVLVSVNENLNLVDYPTSWTQFNATITGLGGPTSGRFAFAYQVPNGGPSGANSDFIGIDSVQYTAVPEPATIAVLGLGAAALLRRRRRN